MSREKTIYRFGLLALVVALAAMLVLFGVAQSGYRWEVPPLIVEALFIGPLAAAAIVFAAFVAAARAAWFRGLRPWARAAYWLIGAAALLAAAAVLLAEPAQWPVSSPGLSAAASAWWRPAAAACVLLYAIIEPRATR